MVRRRHLADSPETGGMSVGRGERSRADQQRPALLVTHACWSLEEGHEPHRLDASSELIGDPCRDPWAASFGTQLAPVERVVSRRRASMGPHSRRT